MVQEKREEVGSPNGRGRERDQREVLGGERERVSGRGKGRQKLRPRRKSLLAHL